MGLRVRVLRGLALAGFVLGGVVCRFVCRVSGDGGLCRGAVRLVDRRAGQPPGRVRHDPLLFLAPAGRAARRRQGRRRRQGAVRDRPVPGRAAELPGRPPGRHGGRKSGDQPHPVRGQQARQGRAAHPGNPVEAARRAVARDGAVRRAAHRRHLPPQRPLRRQRHAEDHRSAEQPRRSGVRDQRGRQDDGQGDHLRRQSRLFQLAPEGRHQDLARATS